MTTEVNVRGILGPKKIQRQNETYVQKSGYLCSSYTYKMRLAKILHTWIL